MPNSFTPGPWKVAGRYNAPKIKGAGYTVATIIVTSKADPTTKQANAQLIHAAPDMYSALKKALVEMKEDLEAWGDCDHSVGVCYCSLKNAIQDTEAALKKARGEA